MTEARDVRMGMYGHSNQVAHHVTYMYDAAGQPWKTQKNVREVLSRLYTGSEIGQGYHGDEDNGEQSAWYLFSSLGFYPLVMGSGEYADRLPAVHEGDGAPGERARPGRQGAEELREERVRAGAEGQRPYVDVDFAPSLAAGEGRRPGLRPWGRSPRRGARARARRPCRSRRTTRCRRLVRTC